MTTPKYLYFGVVMNITIYSKNYYKSEFICSERFKTPPEIKH